MASRLVLLAAVSLAAAAPANESAYSNPIGRIRQEILGAHYDKEVRPTLNQSVPTVVKVDVAHVQLLSVEFSEQTVKILVEIVLTWEDPLLTWDPDKHESITVISTSQADVWIPPVVLYPLIEAKWPKALDTKGYVIVYHNGTVRLSTVSLLVVKCKFDSSYFPFDRQSCRFNFETHNVPGSFLSVVPAREGPNRVCAAEENEAGEWELHETIDMSAQSMSTDVGERRIVTAAIGFQRLAAYYMLNIALPVKMIATTTLVAIFMPSNVRLDRTEKATCGLTAMLAVVILVLTVSDSLPKTKGWSLPTLGAFMLTELVVMFAATLYSMAAIELEAQAEFGMQPPGWLLKATGMYKLVTGWRKGTPADVDSMSTASTAAYNSQRDKKRCKQCEYKTANKFVWKVVLYRVDKVALIAFTLVDWAAVLFIMLYGYVNSDYGKVV